MNTCTFFGHKDCYEDITASLRDILEKLIITQNVNLFYVGNHGQFDAKVHHILKDLEQIYPIQYAVVLAYLPNRKDEYDDFSDTMFPEGIETVHPRFAVDRRNRWMIDHSDFVVTYIKHSWGGAAKYAEIAKRKGKIIISVI